MLSTKRPQPFSGRSGRNRHNSLSDNAFRHCGTMRPAAKIAARICRHRRRQPERRAWQRRNSMPRRHLGIRAPCRGSGFPLRWARSRPLGSAGRAPGTHGLHRFSRRPALPKMRGVLESAGKPPHSKKSAPRPSRLALPSLATRYPRVNLEKSTADDTDVADRMTFFRSSVIPRNICAVRVIRGLLPFAKG